MITHKHDSNNNNKIETISIAVIALVSTVVITDYIIYRINVSVMDTLQSFWFIKK